MADIKIMFKNGSNLDKKTLLSLIKTIHKICINLSLVDIKDKIIHGIPIPVKFEYDVSEEFLNLLQEKNVDTQIGYDNQNLSIHDFLEKMEEENDFDEDEEEFDKEEYKFYLLQDFIKKIINNIMKNINDDNLINNNKNDYHKGQWMAYYKIVTQLKKEAIVFGIDYTELEDLIIICEENIKK
jgi:hypothetical protein